MFKKNVLFCKEKWIFAFCHFLSIIFKGKIILKNGKKGTVKVLTKDNFDKEIKDN